MVNIVLPYGEPLCYILPCNVLQPFKVVNTLHRVATVNLDIFMLEYRQQNSKLYYSVALMPTNYNIHMYIRIHAYIHMHT